MKKAKKLLIFLLFLNICFTQTLVINEVMSSNVTGIEDEDGEFSDWIEIYNTSDTDMELDGFGISDDPDEPFKWTFPAITLNPQQYLLLFASGKDQLSWTNHWETIINWGDVWKYRVNNDEAPISWKSRGFNDSNWSSGASGIGYGDGDDATNIPYGTISFYARKTFQINDLENITSGMFHIDYDDGFVAYLNGIEIARENMVGSDPAWDKPAENYVEPVIINGNSPQKYMIQNISNLLFIGENVLAIQLHNTGTGSSDLTFIPFLTLGMTSPPENPSGVPDILNVPVSFLHTNFKINSSGETLLISNKDGVIADQKVLPEIPADISYGRMPNGGEQWAFFEEPTPGNSNSENGYLGFSGDVQFSDQGGFYDNGILLTLSDLSETSEIRYTTDGSDPKVNTLLYNSPLNINETMVVRARVFEEGKLPGKIITNTFIINNPHELPVVSLSTTPANFFDEEFGIYALGTDYDPNVPYFGANFWEDWERPIHVEFFEEDGDLGFSIDAGVKIFGGWSRASAQKPMAIFARGSYGYSEIPYQIFPDIPIDSFQGFVLRNSANDMPYTMFRDGMMQELVKGTNIDLNGFLPVAVYLNGEYWGLYNIREKLNEHYVAAHHDLDPGKIDLLEGNGSVNNGDNEAYWNFNNYIAGNNFHNQENYEYIKTQMDIENFIEYQIAEIYYGNTDWPGNNIKYWREKVPNGKWRWILFDTDFGFGLYDDYGYQHNTLEFATEANGPEWPNPPWSTLILRKLLTNLEFRNQFINTYADFINTRFKSTNINEIIDEYQAEIEHEMQMHYLKWQESYWWGSLSDWYNRINILKIFGQQRVSFARNHLISKFDLDGTARVRLSISPENSGKMEINTVETDGNWTGYYFQGVPIRLEAKPAKGYKFSEWSGTDQEGQEIFVDLTGNVYIQAHFEIDETQDAEIIINEINYNSSNNFDTGDWVELYNKSDTDLDISEWIFKDVNDLHEFIIPASTVIQADSYLIICENKTAFSELFSEDENVIGDFNFGLSGNGELLRLFNSFGDLVDSVRYGVAEPWPDTPDGLGPTLALLRPDLDNSFATNWSASENYYGTPGSVNFLNSIKNNISNLPGQFSMGQNYPNPFNNSTIIPLEICKRTKVDLKIYDIHGKLVDSILDKQMEPGKYKINYICRNSLASGIYFYKIIGGDSFVKTQKFIYIK